MAGYQIRLATAEDAAVIAHHRVRMFEDIGKLALADVEPVRSATERKVARDLASGTYVGWLAAADGEVVACAGVLMMNGKDSRGIAGQIVTETFDYDDGVYRLGSSPIRRIKQDARAVYG